MVTVHIHRPEWQISPNAYGIAVCGFTTFDNEHIIDSGLNVGGWNRERGRHILGTVCPVCFEWWRVFHIIKSTSVPDVLRAILAELRYHGIPMGESKRVNYTQDDYADEED